MARGGEIELKEVREEKGKTYSSGDLPGMTHLNSILSSKFLSRWNVSYVVNDSVNTCASYLSITTDSITGEPNKHKQY